MLSNIFKSKVIKNLTWLIFDKIITLLVGIIVIFKVANHYGPVEYGLFQYATSLNLIFGIVLLLIDSRVVKKKYSKNNISHIIFNTTLTKIFLSIISLFIGMIFLYFLNQGLNFNKIYIILLLNNIIINLSFGIQNYFEFVLKSKKIVIASNVAIILSAIFQLICISLNYSIIIITLVIFLASVVKMIILFFQFYKSFTFSLISKVDFNLIIDFIKESIPLAIAGIAATIYSRIDQVMIGSILGYEEVGIYSISVQMISIVSMILIPFQVSIYPEMINWFKSNIKIYYKNYLTITSIISWVSIIGIVLSVLLSYLFFDLIFDEMYSESLNIFQIHIMGVFFMYNAILRSSHFTLTKTSYILMISQIIAVFLNIILNFILIPKSGIYGAAFSTVFTQIFSLLLSNLFFSESKKIFWIQIRGLNPKYFISELKRKMN